MRGPKGPTKPGRVRSRRGRGSGTRKPNHDNTVSLAIRDRWTSGQTVARRGSAQLRELAGWYRDFAERAGSPNIWEGRVRTAVDLDEEAGRIKPLARR